MKLCMCNGIISPHDYGDFDCIASQEDSVDKVLLRDQRASEALDRVIARVTLQAQVGNPKNSLINPYFQCDNSLLTDNLACTD